MLTLIVNSGCSKKTAEKPQVGAEVVLGNQAVDPSSTTASPTQEQTNTSYSPPELLPPPPVSPVEQKTLDALPRLTRSQNLPDETVALLKEGEALLELTTQAIPDSEAAQHLRAQFMLDFGEASQAKEIWQALLEKNSANLTVVEGLLQVAKQEGDFEAVVRYSRQALKLEPGNPNYRLELGVALLDAAEIEESSDVLGKIVADYPRNPEARVEYACVLLQLDELESAKEQLEKALELAPDQRSVHLELGKTYSRLGSRDLAKKHFEEHRRLQAEFSAQDTQARQQYDDDAANQKDISALCSNLARLFLEDQKVTIGQTLLERAYHLDDQNIDCRQMLSLLFAKRNDFAKAIEYLDEIAELHPKQFVLARDTVNLLLQAGKQDEAVQRLIQFTTANPQDIEAAAACSQFFMSQVPRPAEALKLAQQVVDLQASPQAFLLLASAQEFAGQRDAAIKTLDRAIVMDPGNPQYAQLQNMLRSRAAAPQPKTP
ncbi:MAG: tetratricopeptide repeat protein [Planctomycetota bacterium]